MNENETWVAFSWHCPYCGNVVTGVENKKGSIRAQCDLCHAVMVRTPKGRNPDTVRIYPSEELMESI